MKKLQIIILLTVLLTACKTKNTDIVIKGTIVDKHPKEILFSGLFNNNYNSWFKKSVTPDSTGNFVISEKIEEPCFVMILYNKTSKQIILEPGNAYSAESGHPFRKLTDTFLEKKLCVNLKNFSGHFSKFSA